MPAATLMATIAGGACRRAAAAADAAYARAARIAEDQDWSGQAALVRDLRNTNENQWQLLDKLVIGADRGDGVSELAPREVFAPRDRKDVLVAGTFGGDVPTGCQGVE
jgi:hypothetical protein